MLSPESVRRISQGIKEGLSGDISNQGDVPLHSKIAAKIKAESLARSSVGGSGTAPLFIFESSRRHACAFGKYLFASSNTSHLFCLTSCSA